MYFTLSFHCTKPLSIRATTRNGTKYFRYMVMHSRAPTVRSGLRSGAADVYPSQRLDALSTDGLLPCASNWLNKDL